MQELKGFGLTLNLVDETTAEQVRLWRNDAEISQFMDFKEHISEEMQQIWLKNVQSSNDLFYVISKDEKLIGTIHLSQIDPIKKTAEAGIFIGEKNFSGTGITLGASLLLLDFAFNSLELQSVFAKINVANKAAEQYNQLLGFGLSKSIDVSFNSWVIKKETFLNRKNFLEKMI